MPSFPYVKKGDEFKPILELENAVRRMVNRQAGFSQGRSLAGNNACKVSVLNASDVEISAGDAVMFLSDEDSDSEVIPCQKADSVSAPWGICTSDLSPDEIGSCIVSGPVEVELSGTGDFAAPNTSSPGAMVAGSSGAPILYRVDDTTAIINLGGGSGSAAPSYNGMHKLVLITDNSNPEAPTYKVCVCDGATYDPKTHTSGESRVEVNGVAFNIKSTVFELEKSRSAVVVGIKFTAGTQTQKSKVEYTKTYRILPDNTDAEMYYLLGRITYNDTTTVPYIHQDHVSPNGVASILWGIACDA